jgi:hypothetical protein
MDVRMFGVPMRDGGPIEFRAEIPLHLAHEIAGERAQIGHLESVIGRNDEPEMMSITLAPLGKRARVAVLPVRAEHAGELTFFADTLAPEIA